MPRSEVEVVWQDGTVEKGIPSRELYPIHHLDEHEFFPGDFVTEARDGFEPHHYGVVQQVGERATVVLLVAQVEHAARCARIKWFRTYTEGATPQPIYCSSSEASVYDLKDHPDFKYRPGSIVIRVMNSAGEDCGLGAGQVRTWQLLLLCSRCWTTRPVGRCLCGGQARWRGRGSGLLAGHRTYTRCWSCSWSYCCQVGEYDSDEGELWEDEEEEEGSEAGDSWETESEQEVEGVDQEELHTDAMDLKPKLAANIERARLAMARYSCSPTTSTIQRPGWRKFSERTKVCRARTS